MALQELKTVVEAQFDGFVTRKNGDIDLKVKAPYSELVHVMSLLRMIDCNIGISCKVNQGKPFTLGTFWLYKVIIDKDGESKITFNTELTSSEYESFKQLLAPEAVILIQAKAVVDSDE